jgi:hypothetical protein
MPNGSLDETFLGEWAQGPIDRYALQTDGKFLIAVDSGRGIGLARLTSAGQMDLDFKRFEPPSNLDFFAPAPDGKILASYFIYDTTRVITRLESDGNIDNSFLAGTYDVLLTDTWFSSFSVTPESTGNWLLQGDFSAVNGQPRPGLARLLLNESGPRVVLDETAPNPAETNGNVRIRLVRTGDNTAPFTVNWTTDGGTARAGVDYITASGTVTFPANEAEQEIVLALLDNGQIDDDRTVRLRLTTPAGASLPPVDVAIAENDLGFVADRVRAFANGRFLLTVNGHRTHPNVRVQRSNDLQQWEDFWWPFNDSQFLDLDATGQPHGRRYYRIVADQ